MITFAFLCLTLALYALAGYFAYRYAKQELKTSLRAHMRQMVRKEKAHNDVVMAIKAELDTFTNIVRQMPQSKNLVQQSLNVKDNMEARYAAQTPQVVAVDGVQKVI